MPAEWTPHDGGERHARLDVAVRAAFEAGCAEVKGWAAIGGSADHKRRILADVRAAWRKLATPPPVELPMPPYRFQDDPSLSGPTGMVVAYRLAQPQENEDDAS